MARSNGLCQDCLNANPRRLQRADVVDHILPLAKGGDDVDSNTRNLCNPCHEKRTGEQFGFKHRPTIGHDGWGIEE